NGIDEPTFGFDSGNRREIVRVAREDDRGIINTREHDHVCRELSINAFFSAEFSRREIIWNASRPAELELIVVAFDAGLHLAPSACTCLNGGASSIEIMLYLHECLAPFRPGRACLDSFAVPPREITLLQFPVGWDPVGPAIDVFDDVPV